MKKVACLFSFFFVLSSGIALAQSVYQRIYFEASPSQIQSVIRKGIALDHLLPQGNGFIAEISDLEVGIMKDAGITVNVIIADLSLEFTKKYSSFNNFSGSRDFTQPEHFHAGSMGGALTLSEVWDELDSMKLYFPDLITEKENIGTSYEGRPIYMVKISDTPDVDENEPEVEFDALHHAREPVSMMQIIYYMWWLLENYDEDSLASYLVNEREIYFVPVVNPDGYYYNESTDPDGGGYWRKNRRDNGDGTFGVDLNRNYGWEWGHDSGSSDESWTDVYRGTESFSEPETATMRDFFSAHEFTNTVSCHSFGDFLINPWGYSETACDDADWFSGFSERATRWSDYDHGNTVLTVGYLASGTTTDFNYGDTILKPRSMAFTPETGYSFWPAPGDIPDLCAGILEQNILCTYLPNAIFTISTVNEMSSDDISMAVPFSVNNVGLQQGNVKCYLQSDSPYLIDDGDSIEVMNVDVLASAIAEIPVQLNETTPNGALINALLIADDGILTDTAYITIEYTGVPASIDQATAFLNVFPNPADDFISLAGAHQNVTLLFFDITGRKLLSVKPNLDPIDISMLPKGIYIIEIQNGDESERVRLVKK
ncbi:MAG: T9SS type A sorting domain-containing protein [Chitinophagales bacterium]|nr:T9SS type A sorting domain-containing protein [Chitinophagales bacterium]